MPEVPHLDAIEKEMFALLGQIVWQCSWIESNLRGIIAVQEGIINPIDAAKKLARLPGKNLLERAAAYIEQQEDDRAKTDAKYLRNLTWIFEDRNDYVHGIHWVGSSWSRLRVTKTAPHVSEDVISLDEMKAFYQALKEIHEDLSSMQFFRGLLPDGFGFQTY